MATKNKKDTVTDLTANIYTNVAKEVTADKVKTPFNDLINSLSFNITVAQLQAEDDSAVHTFANIIDSNKQGVFFYDSSDLVTTDDGGSSVIVTSNGKRYKRLLLNTHKVDARWFGGSNAYFASVAAANTAIKAAVRFIGLNMDVNANGIITPYWYRDGIADVNLVPKNPEIQVKQFIVGDGQSTTPADNTDTFTHTDLIGRTIILVLYPLTPLALTIKPTTLAGYAYTYAQSEPAVGKVKLLNGVFTTGSACIILYK